MGRAKKCEKSGLTRGGVGVGLVVGVTLMLAPGVGASFAVAGMTSARGRSHTFDERADGYARGEACGGVALRGGVNDGAALGLLGSAVRQDGRSASLTAPNGQAQQGLLVAALQDASTSVDMLALNEAHGTGTALGDPIEAGSLVGAVLSAREEVLAGGGVKANIGHVEPAAGMTGLLKLAVGLRMGEAAPNAQLRLLNPHVGNTLGGVAGALPVQLAAVTMGSGGVSSFGYSGTIFHEVVCSRALHTPHRDSGPMSSIFYRRRSISLCVTTFPVEHAIATIKSTLGGTVDLDVPLMEAGLDSLGAVQLQQDIQSAASASFSLPSTFVFDYPTTRQLVALLDSSATGSLRPREFELVSITSIAMTSRAADVTGVDALIPGGVSCVRAVMTISLAGCDLLCIIPSQRWSVEWAVHSFTTIHPDVASRAQHGGFLRGAELFDHHFFRTSSSEAVAMDPQQRMLLERGYGALHAAGMSKRCLIGANIAVSVGQWSSEFESVLQGKPALNSVYALTSFSCSVTCGRVSFVLDLMAHVPRATQHVRLRLLQTTPVSRHYSTSNAMLP